MDANVRPLREQARTWAGSRCRPQPRTARTAKPGESDRRGRHILGRCEKLSLGFRLEEAGHGRRVTAHLNFQSVPIDGVVTGGLQGHIFMLGRVDSNLPLLELALILDEKVFDGICCFSIRS